MLYLYNIINGSKRVETRKMARFGITYQDVESIAEQLQGQGLNPTVEAVRRISGTGSHGTISTHLREWKKKAIETQNSVLKKELPETLALSLKGLWERIITEAETKIQVVKDEIADEVLKLKNQSLQLTTENTNLQQYSRTLKHEQDVLVHNKQELEQTIIELKKQNALLDSKNEATLQQLQDKQDRVNELNHLHKQTQSNLLHYQESSREQRQLELQRHEQQQYQLTQIINQLEQKLIASQQQYAGLNEKFYQSCEEKEVIQKSNHALQSQIDKMQIQLTQVEKNDAEKTQALNQLQAQAKILKEKLNQQGDINVDLQKQIAILSQQLSNSQHGAKELSDQNKSLISEKWLLGQEKGQLEGQLKQLGMLLQKQTIVS